MRKQTGSKVEAEIPKNVSNTSAKRKQKSEQKASGTQATEQNRSKSIAVCPFFDAAAGKELTCAEGVPIKGTQSRITFFNRKQREAYMRQYCRGEYRSCPFLQVVLCPYNEGVDCREKKHCERCGWNPEVRQRRLILWLSSRE